MKRLSARPTRLKIPTGYILYEGPSLIGDGDIVCIAVLQSNNEKTGNMVQTYIIPKDTDPLTALHKGENVSACGTCPLQGEYTDGKMHNRVCYVNIGHGPLAVYKAYVAGNYQKYQRHLNECMLAGRRIRIGTYGDPAALPVSLVKYLANISSGFTGYSHQMFWVPHAEELAPYVMVSCHTPAQHREAMRRGWRAFTVVPEGGAIPERSVECPYYTHGVQCERCLLCDGTNKQAKSVYTIAHATVGTNLPKVMAIQGDAL